MMLKKRPESECKLEFVPKENENKCSDTKAYRRKSYIFITELKITEEITEICFSKFD